jgi:hypothetical protein
MVLMWIVILKVSRYFSENKSLFISGFFTIRAGADKSPLPSARLVSTRIMGTASRPANFNAMVPAFGQFLIHDISSVPVSDG